MIMSLIKLIHFQCMGDDRGKLIALENLKNIPFTIKRVYYIFDTQQDVIRGLHAHKNLKQVAIALKGSCTFVLNDGKQREEVLLDSPHQGLLIDSCIWREMHNFSSDCVLLVLASELYDETDYIRDFAAFEKEIKQ